MAVFEGTRRSSKRSEEWASSIRRPNRWKVDCNPIYFRLVNVLVLTSDVPFVTGGHRVFAQALEAALASAGFPAEVMTTPTNRFGRQLSAYLANRLIDVGMTGDGRPIELVVSLRYPAFMVKHPRHRMWLTHLLREYYDLWDRLRTTLPPGFLNRRLLTERIRRAIIRRLDKKALRKLERMFVISKNVQARLTRYLGISSEVLYPPPKERAYRTESPEGFILAPSRLHPLKRQDLLRRALKELPWKRAIIVGEGDFRPRLESLATELGVADRVRCAGFVSDETLCDLYARCSTVYFCPEDEDYGFVTLEAFRSRKPVVTCRDSGGPTELVVPSQSGFIADPAPGAVADALGTLVDDPARCRKLGEAGYEATRELTWPRAVDTLLS